MSPAQSDDLARLVQHHYPAHPCGPQTPAAQARWQTELAPFTPEEGREALRAWWRYHRDGPPTLDELVRRCQVVRGEASTWRRGLQEPADLSPDQATFGQLMTQLATRTIVARLTLRECAIQCEAWAEMNVHRPDLARDLLAAAQGYRQLAAAEVPAMWEATTA